MRRPIFLYGELAEKIHEASLDVLENTGLSLYHNGEESKDLLLSNGAKEDMGRILIPRKMVNEALEKVPKGFKLHDRDGAEHIEIKNGPTYFGPGSDSLYNYNKKTGRSRATDVAHPTRSNLGDLRENVKIADALGFDFMMSMALPQDVEHQKERLYPTVFAEMIKNTNKPIVFTSTDLADVQDINHLAKIGSAKPFHVAYVEPISPLKFDISCTQRLLYCAENNIPISFAAGANCGGGAPITPEGGVIQGNAESLAGLVIGTLKNEDLKFVYGANTSAMGMRETIVCYGAPEWAKTVAMYADMGKFYNLPSWGTAGCTDAWVINAQAGAESYEGILMAMLSGSTLVHDVGFLGHGEAYHAGMLVLTKSLIDRAKKLLKEPDVSSESISKVKEAIDDVARSDGLYLAHNHTVQNYRDALWMPPSFYEKGRMEDWEPNKLQDSLNEEANRILSEHNLLSLAADKVKKIDDYVDMI
jgi:trimethylamine--corrinoid protein Co-methyltransferase